MHSKILTLLNLIIQKTESNEENYRGVSNKSLEWQITQQNPRRCWYATIWHSMYIEYINTQLCFNLDLHYKDEMYREKPSQTLMYQRMWKLDDLN